MRGIIDEPGSGGGEGWQPIGYISDDAVPRDQVWVATTGTPPPTTADQPGYWAQLHVYAHAANSTPYAPNRAARRKAAKGNRHK